MCFAEGLREPKRGRRAGIDQEDTGDFCPILRHYLRPNTRYVVPDKLEWQTLTRAGVRVGCRIVKMEHWVCLIDFNNIVAEYIGFDDTFSSSCTSMLLLSDSHC